MTANRGFKNCGMYCGMFIIFFLTNASKHIFIHIERKPKDNMEQPVVAPDCIFNVTLSFLSKYDIISDFEFVATTKSVVYWKFHCHFFILQHGAEIKEQMPFLMFGSKVDFLNYMTQKL